MRKESNNKRPLSKAFAERQIGSSGLILNNVFIKSATFEGMYSEGIPTQKLIDHHVALAKGGVGLTTISYGAVSADARTFDKQMYINNDSLKVLELLAQKVHDPEFLNKIRQGFITKSLCNRCDECIVEMDKGGIKCFLDSAG